MNKIKPILIATLKKTNLFSVARFLNTSFKMLIKPEFRRRELERWRRERAQRKRFLQFKQQYADILGLTLKSGGNSGKRVLIIGAIRLQEIELGLIKALEVAGYEPVILIMRDSSLLKRYYDLLGGKEIHFWSEFCDASRFFPLAAGVVEQCRSIEELLKFEFAGTRVGRIAASTTLRILQSAALDLTSDIVRQTVAKEVALGMASAIAAQKVIRIVQPKLALSIETVYTGKGEIFEMCIAKGVDFIRWHPAHKSNTLMLKRYTLENRDDNPHSLSVQSWQSVYSMEWTDAHHEQLKRELHDSYASGEWYGENGTQFSKRLMDADEIRARLGLDPGKRTAFLFPHIFWDASFSYGDNLFENYEEWFIKTVQAACDNERVNWVIKIHPANIGKNGKSRSNMEPAEVTTLRSHIGELPAHIFLIPAESDICTYSLFEIMDYCITVRGTIGIEAAIRGIPVLTAGTGRYDHKGFSIDSETSEEYLKRIAHIQEIQPLSPAQRELAERYAYGLFMLRPLPLTTMTLEFDRDNDPGNYYAKTRFQIKTKEEWYSASDIGTFAKWVTASVQEDFINCSF